MIVKMETISLMEVFERLGEYDLPEALAPSTLTFVPGAAYFNNEHILIVEFDVEVEDEQTSS